MRRALVRLVALVLHLIALSGCTIVHITSEPASAEILYSPTGQPPWEAWPPRASKAPDTASSKPIEPKRTPSWKAMIAEPYYFVRVAMEGYHPVRPEFVDARWFQVRHIRFHLEPTPELFARRQSERGLVLYQGRWVAPAEAGIVEHEGEWMRPEEKFTLEQKAKGLVLDVAENRWVTPQEKAQLETARMLAKGLVGYKGRWMPPQEAELENLIDRHAERLAASTGTFELRIERIGPVFSSGTQMRIADLTGHPLEVLLSGPRSQRLRVPPYNSVSVESEPGTYTLVVQEVGRPDAAVAVGRVRLAARNRYSATYRGPLHRRKFLAPLPETVRGTSATLEVVPPPSPQDMPPPLPAGKEP